VGPPLQPWFGPVRRLLVTPVWSRPRGDPRGGGTGAGSGHGEGVRQPGRLVRDRGGLGVGGARAKRTGFGGDPTGVGGFAVPGGVERPQRNAAAPGRSVRPRRATRRGAEGAGGSGGVRRPHRRDLLQRRALPPQGRAALAARRYGGPGRRGLLP